MLCTSRIDFKFVGEAIIESIKLTRVNRPFYLQSQMKIAIK